MIKKLLLFFALCFGELCFALVFVVIFVNSTVVDCSLQSDRSYNCQIRTLLLGKVQTFEKRVEHVVDITMARDSCDDGCAYRAEFATSAGERVPLSEVYTDQGLVLQQVNALRVQMNSHKERITYTSDPTWWVLYLLGGLTLMGMLVSLSVFLQRK